MKENKANKHNFMNKNFFKIEVTAFENIKNKLMEMLDCFCVKKD